MTFSSDDRSTQAFRSPSSDEIVYVQVQIDPMTREPIVLWSDILRKFENAKFIKDGDSSVLFLTDANLEEAIPLRIAYCPGVVLDVVEGGDQAASRSGSDGSVVTQSIVNYSGGMPRGNLPVVRHSEGMPDGPVHPYVQTILMGQEIQARNVKQFIDQRFEQLMTTMDRDRALQELLIWLQRKTGDNQLKIQHLQQQTKEELLDGMVMLYQLQQDTEAQLIKKQQEIQDLQLQTREELGKKQEEILQLQTSALDVLAIIQSRVQALATQSYELHENPIPRLFVVLPIAPQNHDRTTNLRPDQFRLFLLCECGKHTTPQGSATTHEIHFAKHEGYELENPKEFFEKYGSYVLTMMYMIKYGIVSAGLNVPPLTKIVDGFDGARGDSECLKSSIVPLVDDTIDFLRSFSGTNEPIIEPAAVQYDIDKPDVLSVANLKQLDSYLKVKDQECTPGNLFRILTPEGHVKWVCLDHYRSNNRESAFNQLREVLNFNHGIFTEEESKVEIRIMSASVATLFYAALVKARNVQELNITLEWDATMDDLRNLASAVTKANVVSLIMNGSYLKGPARDAHNRNRRFEPILQLASNGRIQSLQLDGFDDFFSRINNIPSTVTFKIRAFQLEWNGPYKDKSIKSFQGFLMRCDYLTSLKLKYQENNRIESVMPPETDASTLRLDVEFIEYGTLVSQDDVQHKGSKKGVVQRSTRFLKKMVGAKVGNSSTTQFDIQNRNERLSPLRSSKTPMVSQSENTLVSTISPPHKKTSKSHTDLNSENWNLVTKKTSRGQLLEIPNDSFGEIPPFLQAGTSQDRSTTTAGARQGWGARRKTTSGPVTRTHGVDSSSPEVHV